MKKLLFALAVLAALSARADERMNGMVGLYYHSRNTFAFEYDYILQFQKSKEWIGNLNGPFVSEEASVRSNRLGIGMLLGKRTSEKGTYAASVEAFEENRWSSFSNPRTGWEAKISISIVGVKVGFMDWDWDKRYFAVGFSY